MKARLDASWSSVENCKMCAFLQKSNIFAQPDDRLAAMLNPNAPTSFMRFAIIGAYHDPTLECGHLGSAVYSLAKKSYEAIERICEELGVAKPLGLRLFSKGNILTDHANWDFIPLYDKPTRYKGVNFRNTFGVDNQNREILIGSRKGCPTLDSEIYLELTKMMEEKVNKLSC